MPSPEHPVLAAAPLQELALIAVGAVRCGLPDVTTDTTAPRTPHRAIRATGASFVTLKRHGQLRGCIGSLERRRALALDVAENAYAAAFRDPRFPPLCATELASTCLEVSVLSPPVALAFASAEELLASLRPGIDGVIVRYREQHATFLPAVWEALPDPRRFLDELCAKAGIAPGIAMTALTIHRYTTQRAGPVPLD